MSPNQYHELPPVDQEAQIDTAKYARELRRERRHKKLRIVLVCLLLLILLAGALAAAYFVYKKHTTAANNTHSSQGDVVHTGKTLLYYAAQVDSVHGPSREWPTFAIYRMTAGESASTEVMRVGAEGSYPADIAVSKAGKYLLVNYETKMQVYDLATAKEVVTIPAPSGLHFSTPVFSAAEDKLFAYELTEPGATAASISATTVTIPAGQASRDTLAANTPSLSANAWSKTDKIVSNLVSYSEFTAPYVYDLSNKTLTRLVADSIDNFKVSPDGSKLVIPSAGRDDPTNCVSGRGPSGFTLVAVDTATPANSYVNSGYVLNLGQSQFSDDASKLLVPRYIPVSGTDCTTAAATAKERVIINLSNMQEEKITDQTDIATKGFSEQLSLGSDDAKDMLVQYRGNTIQTFKPNTAVKLLPVVNN